MRIALLEDDSSQAGVLMVWLEEAGHTCVHFDTARAFMQNIIHESYDLVILDWVLPDISGDEVMKWIRSHLDSYVPVIFVTVRDSEEDVIRGLSCGADDYMTKPIRPREMLARIKAVTRRQQTTAVVESALEIGEFVINPQNKTIRRDGQDIELTHKEFELACFLLQNSGRIYSRGYLLENIWGKITDINTRTVDTHISRIRNKLKLDKEHGWNLNAIYQHGYRLEKWVAESDAPAPST